MIRRFVSLFGLAATVSTSLSCTKRTDYLYYQPVAPFHSVSQKIREVHGTNNLDMFWTIGGMDEQQDNFRQGVTDFMQTFTAKPYSWRMAVSSSNTSDRPYIGMPAVFDNTVPNPTPVFVNAVMGALNGQDDEKIFDPIFSNLNLYPSFLRPDSVLVLILTNDEYDESHMMRSASAMLQYLVGLKGGDKSKVVVYGVFGASDLNCRLDQIDSDWNYHGSEFEALINATGGAVYSLCDDTFGAQLAKLGDNLYQKLDHPTIHLDQVPDASTLHVYYHGAELPGGPKASGGYWYFSIRDNSVVFYNLDFAASSTEEVKVTYSEAVTP